MFACWFVAGLIIGAILMGGLMLNYYSSVVAAAVKDILKEKGIDIDET